jgi:hypothetical protein
MASKKQVLYQLKLKNKSFTANFSMCLFLMLIIYYYKKNKQLIINFFIENALFLY